MIWARAKISVSHVRHVIVLFQACRLHFFYISFASMHIWEMSANWQNYKSILIDFLLQCAHSQCAVVSQTKSTWLLYTLSHTRHELTLTRAEKKVNANRMTSTTLLLHQRNAEISNLMGIIHTSERCCHWFIAKILCIHLHERFASIQSDVTIHKLRDLCKKKTVWNWIEMKQNLK